MPNESPRSRAAACLGRCLVVAAIAAVATAAPMPQEPVGTTFRVAPSIASRGALNNLAGTLLARFDRDDLRGFGMTTPGQHVIQGVVVELQDYDASTAESFAVALFPEDPAQPGYPRMSAPLATSATVTLPAGTAGPANYSRTVWFAAPVTIAAGKDLFVGVILPTAAQWPLDGLAVQTVLGHASRWPTFDQPGPAPIQNGGYALMSASNGTFGYSTMRQLVVDLVTPTPGGAVLVTTNQTSYAIGNTAPGGGGLLSPLHPDASATPYNQGRADDPGFAFLDASLPDGTPVFFFGDFSAFGPDVSLQALAPGSRGVACLPLGTAVTFGLQPLASGQAILSLTVPPGFRSFVSGLVLLQQAVAFDAVGRLHASPCYRSSF